MPRADPDGDYADTGTGVGYLGGPCHASGYELTWEKGERAFSLGYSRIYRAKNKLAVYSG